MANYTSDLAQVDIDRNNALSNLDQQYSDAIRETEQVYDKAAEQYVIDANDGKTTAVEQLMETQTALTNQAIAEIEQEREQNEKDYIKEQAASYADWQKQSDAYGVNAEKMAANGLTRSGYSESSQVQMYSDYQARVTSARETFKRAELNFTNAITNARLQNNAALAQIALDAFQKQSEIAIAGLTAKNGLLSEWTSQKIAVNTMYDNRYQTILDQIYREEQLALEREKMAQDAAQWSAQMAQDQAQFDAQMADKQADRDWQAQQNQIDREWEMEQYNTKTAAANQETKYNRLADLISSSGHEPTDEELKAAGMSRSEANSYLKYYNENKKTSGTKLSNNSGTTLTGNGGNTKDDTTTYPELYNPFPVLGVLNTPTRIGSDTTGSRNKTITPRDDTSALLQEAYNAGTPTPKTYNEATTILKNMGVNSSGLMNSREWASHRNSGNATDPAAWFSSYQDYLTYYIYGATVSTATTYTDPPKKKTTTNGAGGSANTTTWEKPTGAIM